MASHHRIRMKMNATTLDENSQSELKQFSTAKLKEYFDNSRPKSLMSNHKEDEAINLQIIENQFNRRWDQNALQTPVHKSQLASKTVLESKLYKGYFEQKRMSPKLISPVSKELEI